MYSWIGPIAAVVLLMLMSSCSSIRHMAVGTTGSLLYEAAPALESESDFEVFKESVPANIKVMEGLLSLSPKDRDLLAALVKAHAGYGFGVYETLDLKDFYLDSKKRPWRERALLFYSRALEYGQRYLQEEGVDFEGLLEKLRDSKAQDYLSSNLDRTDLRDREVALFSAQALAGLINYSRDNMAMVAQLPIAKALFDWGCNYDQNINYGACDIFYGAYFAGRPKMLGGDSQRGREYFEKAQVKYADNFLIDAAYLQYYVVPMLDELLYQSMKSKLLKAHEEFETNKYWSPLKKRSKRPYALYQAIGLKRALSIIESEKEWL